MLRHAIAAAFFCLVLHGAVEAEPTLVEIEQAEAWRHREPRSTRDVADHEWDAYARPVPEWLQDGKLGVYAHWGPYNQGMERAGYTGMNNSWFSKYLYVKGHPYNKHHSEAVGLLSQYGYSHYFDTFAASSFDPVEWADAVASSGARFAGPVAMHHDGFAMWDSKLVPWNGMTCAAERDFAGELIREYRRRGLKIVSSFHHAFNVSGQFYGGREGRLDDLPIDLNSELNDPEFAKLYGRFETQAEAEAYWLAIVKEYVREHRPDQLWFDGGLSRLSDQVLFEMTQFYYDFCEREGIEGIISQKKNQIPRRVSLFDHERGGAAAIIPRTWQTDDSPGPWMFIEGAEFKGADWVVPLLVDIVSKNGVLLLNIAPRADGAIVPEQKETLRGVGEWLAVHGEAIYASRPWRVHYQGKEPHFYSDGKAFAKTYARYGSDDFRFTRSKDGRTLFLAAMGPPPTSDVVIDSLSVNDLGPESGASLVGSPVVAPLDYSEDGRVVLPAKQLLDVSPARCEGPRVFRISGLRP